MRPISKFLRCIFLSLLLTNIATAGNEGGGGDPDAVDFLNKTTTIGEWVLRTHSGLSDTDTQIINQTAKKLSLLMDDSTVTPISMVDQDLFDPSGASKIALFDLETFKIQVTRGKWQSLNEEDKFVVAALELFGLAKIENRYAVAGIIKKDILRIEQMNEVVNQNWSYISAIKTVGIVTYETPGIYKTTKDIFSMAVNLKDVDVDFDTQTMGLKMATEFCKSLGHQTGVSVSFKTFAQGSVGAFFKLDRGYIGLRLVNASGTQPDIAVRHLNCKD